MKVKRYIEFIKTIILRKYLMTKCDGDIGKKTINKEALVLRNDILSIIRLKEIIIRNMIETDIPEVVQLHMYVFSNFFISD